jgi:hypothetical protein
VQCHRNQMTFFVMTMLLISACRDVAIKSVRDFDGVYESLGCPKITISEKNIEVNNVNYSYNLVKLKDTYAISMEGSLSYIGREKCNVFLSNHPLYMTLNNKNRISISISSYDLKYDRYLFKRK